MNTTTHKPTVNDLLAGVSNRTRLRIKHSPLIQVHSAIDPPTGKAWGTVVEGGAGMLFTTKPVFDSKEEAKTTLLELIGRLREWKNPETFPPPLPDLEEFEEDVRRWMQGAFGTRTLGGRLRKLGEEFGELAEAVVKLQQGTGTVEDVEAEAADCNLILTDLLGLLGRSLQRASRTKLQVNKLRYPRQ